MSFLSRWRPYHLLLAWGGYWLLLFTVTLGPAVPAILRATRGEGHGEISANMSDTVLTLTVKEMGQATWTGSVHLLIAALWLAVPPLLLWILWLRAAPRASREAQTAGF
jgi:hypothetical protein